ncbi:MAG: hypothetical protein K2F81_09395 [Ruminococcus sp.]|nr:hypothetical protein [Ruminococcus sp.]
MNTDMMFEIAIRNKMRFPYKGQVSVEDLWDLSVEALDTVFKTLNSKVKASQEESLLQTRTKEDEELSIQIAIVKHIVAVKLAEADAAAKARENKDKKQKILSILADKQEDALKNKSVEELRQMLEDME